MRLWGKCCASTMLAMAGSIVIGCGGGGASGGGSTPPPATTYSIGGTVTGLTATGLVLQNNSGNNLSVSANGSSFTFTNSVASGATYSVTVLTQPTGESCTVTNGSGTASANVTSVQVACSNASYTIGGTVSGLIGTGLVLQDNGGDNLTVSANGSFTFSNSVASGAAFSVTVFTQPAGQSCAVANGGGTANANVTNVQVACSNLPPTTYTIGGTVSGLTGAGLVLQDNGGNNLPVSANGSFTFSNSVASGEIYSVTVLTQPTGQSCTVTNDSGTASANVTNIQVTCTTTTYTIGGTISGLTASGLVLADGSQTVSSLSGATSFTFPNAVAAGSSYAVTVKTQPNGETCSVTNGSGTASINVSNVKVTCATTTYTFGGTVSGLTGIGLVLFNGSTGDKLPVNANGSFTFGLTEPSGSTYSVTVLTQPTGQSCTVTNGSGTISANVTNIQVTCTSTTYTIGGTVSGLSGTGLALQDNGGNNLSLSANGAFTFSNSIANGAAYSVTVLTQPAGQSCTVTNGSGTASANVSNVQVSCATTTYTFGGTVSGLTGTGLVLFNGSTGDKLPVSINGSFTFGVTEPSGSSYSVMVLTQPTGQSCTVTNGSGTISANVTNIQVACSNVYTIGGTVSGLTGTGLVLQDNGGNNLGVSANGAFTFSNSVASGATYNVTVLTQPTGQNCALTNGSGTASANVTNVQVACSNVYYTIGGTVSGLTGTGLILQDNGGNNLAVNANGGFTFSNSLARSATYSVTVLTQPAGQTCTVSNGSGTATANVVNVQVACSTVYYTIGGTVSGLIGAPLFLQFNGGIPLEVLTNGTFTFDAGVAAGATYRVAIVTQPNRQSCTVTNGSGTATDNVTNVQVVCSNPISVSVSGLTGSGLVLQNNGGDNLSVIGNGTFTFSTTVASLAAYSVTVLTQPNGQTCTVTNGSGTAGALVRNIQVLCSNITYTISGTVSGLTGTGLVLQDNGGSNLSLSSNGSFAFSNSVNSGAAYSVTILTQPTGQSCTVTSGSGTASANVTNVQVACSAVYTIGGTVSGLTGAGLVLQNNFGGNTLAVSANGSFTFSNSVTSGATYSVKVSSSPLGQFCTVTNGNGTATANVTNIQVTCANQYTIGGTVFGLAPLYTLVLQDNGGNNLAVSANGSFTFSGLIASGTTYNVTVLTEPTFQSCTVSGGRGTANRNVTDVQVICATLYPIGGMVLGLTSSGLVLQDNGGDNLPVSANGTFTFHTTIASGAAYRVTIFTQPSGQTCTVTNGNGTATIAVTNIEVDCESFYTIGGTVTGLSGAGLVLQDNFSNNLSVNTNGAFTFSSPIATAPFAYYSVTVFTQPSGQNCTVTNGSGMATANVTNVQIACTIVYTIGGTVSGLAISRFNVKGLFLQNNGGDKLAVGTNGAFDFLNTVPAGAAAYSVTVFAQPAGQNCTVNNGSGTATADVSNVRVVCVGGWTWMGGSSTVVGTFAATGVYGTLGTPAPTNTPGGRDQAVSWKDGWGNLWLFGGFSWDATGKPVYLSDMWKFDPTLDANGEWTWMGGSTNSNQPGIYGTLGVAGSSNTPGARTGAVTWSDASGNLWLFGGSGFNDMWMFNPTLGATGEWAWMGGSNNGAISGIYGTLGVAAATNIPGGRSGAVSWTDASGHFWLFGGLGSDSNGSDGKLNDLWMFDPTLSFVYGYKALGGWAWMGGSKTAEQSGIYGTLGLAAATNIPGARYGAVSWIDKSDNLWLFGGRGYDSTQPGGYLNDLWKFDPTLGQFGEWTWMGGSSTVGSNYVQPGVYGTLGVAASTNTPGGRQGAVSWSDASGNLRLFGGFFYGATGGPVWLNDVWKFDPTIGVSGEWTWMGGSAYGNQSGVYGTLGTVNSTNIPGARQYGVSWSDGSGSLWLFGGSGIDSSRTVTELNDLWVSQP